MVLEPEEGVPDSDYINASYVDVSTPYYSYTRILVCFADWYNKDSSQLVDCYKVLPPAESGAAEGLHRDPRSDRVDDARLLANGLAREGLLHRHGHQDL